MTEKEELWNEIPSYAWVSLARRGMEKINLDQCFLKNCDNQEITLLEPFKKEEFEDDQKITKKIHIKCKKCGGTFQLKLETIKRVANSTENMERDNLKTSESGDAEDPLSLGLIYALDEKGVNLGHLGYF